MLDSEFKIHLETLSRTPVFEDVYECLNEIDSEFPDVEIEKGSTYRALESEDVSPMLPEGATLATIFAQNPSLVISIYKFLKNRNEVLINGIENEDGDTFKIEEGADIDGETVIYSEGDIIIRIEDDES